jgi:hypothetical protein
MRGRIWFGIIAALLLLGLVAGVGALAYNAGVSQGMWLAGSAAPALPDGTPAAVSPYYAPWMFHRPFGFGFGILACLVPFLLLFTFFALLRFIFGGPRGHRGWGGPGMQGKGNPEDGSFPPHVAEWHRKLHEQDNAAPPAPTA